MNSHIWRTLIVTALLAAGGLASASAAELKVLTAGAFRQVVWPSCPTSKSRPATRSLSKTTPPAVSRKDRGRRGL